MYRCWGRGYGSRRCCIYNDLGYGHISAFQLRNYLCSSSLDEIDTQDPYHSIDFLQPSFYQVLPVSASHDLSSICFLTDAINRQVSCLLLSIYRLTIFGYFINCTVAYMLHLNSTAICFVYKRSMHWCGQVITTAADRSAGLRPAPPSRSAPSCLQSRGSPYGDSGVLQPRPPNNYPSPQPSSILHERREPAWCADDGDRRLLIPSRTGLPPVLCWYGVSLSHVDTTGPHLNAWPSPRAATNLPTPIGPNPRISITRHIGSELSMLTVAIH